MMLVVGIISQALLYICVATCTGHFILSLVKKSFQPKIYVPLTVLVMAIVGIAIFSFFPLSENIFFLSTQIGFLEAMKVVMFTFEIGKAWLLTFVVSTVMILFVFMFNKQRDKMYGVVGLVLSVLLILTLGWSSHGSSIDKVWGFIGDSFHLLAVSVWVGIIFVVSWFSKNTTNWLKFLNWFTPVAIICLLVTAYTGILLMNFMIDWENYTKSWLVPYGQALLWKHLLIIPLLIYALINGILINWRLNTSSSFNPRPWAKIESVIILLIFSATAALGLQSPPKETALKIENFSPLFIAIYQGEVSPNMPINPSFNLISLSLLVLAILFLLLTFLSFTRNAPVVFSFLMSVCIVISVYLSIMFSIQ